MLKPRRPGQNGIMLLISVAMPVLAVIIIANPPVGFTIAILGGLWLHRQLRRDKANHARKLAEHKETWGF